MRLVGLLIAITVLSVAHDTEVNDSDNDPTNLLHPSPTPVGTERVRTNTPTPTPAPTPTSEPTKLGVDKPTPNLLSYPATAIEGGDLAKLTLPANVTVNTSGCASDGSCYWYNFYWAPTHEVVLQGVR